LVIPAGHIAEFTNADGTMITESEIAGTGTVIRLYLDGTLTDTVTVIVFGDTTGDGTVEEWDATRIRLHILGEISLQPAELLAAKTLDQSRLFLADHARVRQHILGEINIHGDADVR